MYNATLTVLDHKKSIGESLRLEPHRYNSFARLGLAKKLVLVVGRSNETNSRSGEEENGKRSTHCVVCICGGGKKMCPAISVQGIANTAS